MLNVKWFNHVSEREGLYILKPETAEYLLLTSNASAEHYVVFWQLAWDFLFVVCFFSCFYRNAIFIWLDENILK